MKEMVALHERLIATIHETEETEGLDPVFQQEIKRRLYAIESGSAKGVDAFLALEKM